MIRFRVNGKFVKSERSYVDAGVKLCPKCGLTKSLEMFGRNKANKEGISSYCVSCRNADASSRYHADPSYMARYNKRYRALNKRRLEDIRMQRYYGITLTYFESMFKSQKGKCAICHVELQAKTMEGKDKCKRPHIDHTMIRGRVVVRGILCSNCNTGIGLLQDNIEIVNNALEYLRRY